MDANMLLSWHRYGGGRELLQKLYASINANVVSFPYGPMYTQPLGWFKKPITKSADFKGLKYRTRSEEHTSELQSLRHIVCRLLLEKNKKPHQRLPACILCTCYIVCRRAHGVEPE